MHILIAPQLTPESREQWARVAEGVSVTHIQAEYDLTTDCVRVTYSRTSYPYPIVFICTRDAFEGLDDSVIKAYLTGTPGQILNLK